MSIPRDASIWSIRSATATFAISTRWTARRRPWKMSPASGPGCRRSSGRTSLSTAMRSTPTRPFESSRSAATLTKSSFSRPAAPSIPTTTPWETRRIIIMDAFVLQPVTSRSGAWSPIMAGCSSACRIRTTRRPCVPSWSNPRPSRCSRRTCAGTSSPTSIPSATSTMPASRATAAN